MQGNIHLLYRQPQAANRKGMLHELCSHSEQPWGGDSEKFELLRPNLFCPPYKGSCASVQKAEA